MKRFRECLAIESDPEAGASRGSWGGRIVSSWFELSLSLTRRNIHPNSPSAGMCLPLPEGEGRGEGEEYVAIELGNAGNVRPVDNGRGIGQPFRRSFLDQLRSRWAMACLLACTAVALCPSVSASSTKPYYKRVKPKPQNPDYFSKDDYPIDLSNTNVHSDPFIDRPVDLSAFTSRFDARAAAIVRARYGVAKGIRVGPSDRPETDLLSVENFKGKGPTIHVLNEKCLAVMAYPDYFPAATNEDRRAMVSEAIVVADPGWCGTFGPGVHRTDLLGDFAEGNYDMAQMHLIPLIYNYYDELTPNAREHLINELLQHGTIHRPGDQDDIYTSGEVPVDWMDAGEVTAPIIGDLKSIGETENHILMILTARYLCNQLLYQRSGLKVHDNRRNSGERDDDKWPSCTDLVLTLLQRILIDDFSEYNSKNYQKETRWALLNLCSYAYDHEVRLAARMVLDYVSARYASSSCDLRRMVPFRRLNQGKNVKQLDGGFMDVGLVDWQLAGDILTAPFALQTGQTRAYDSANPIPDEYNNLVRTNRWVIADGGGDLLVEVHSNYRLPPSIHDLFVNDTNRHFFQRLHRTEREDEVGGGRNCDNREIYAGSPSYLITAGGEPADQPIPGFLIFGNQAKGRGVAVTTSFMPAGESAGAMTQNLARDQIQFGSFSDEPGNVENYGVAPDFACGPRIHLPFWAQGSPDGNFTFVDRSFGGPSRPGFYLAIYQQPENGYAFLEAFDTWLHPEVNFDQFRQGVKARNPNIKLENGAEAQYTTANGNRIHFMILELGSSRHYTEVLRIEYGTGDPKDTLVDAGHDSNAFLSGTIMTSPREAVVEIKNPALGTRIILDMSDKWHPRRVSETGEVEQAGSNNEVWVDFEWTGQTQGDFYHPFNTLAAAVAAVADGGTIKIMPGTSKETPSLSGKRIKLVAPIGDVYIGVQ